MPHILRDYDHAIRHLQEDLLTMATLARQNLEQAMQALLRSDTDLANTVIAADSDVDDLERKVDQIGMEILVRFHPVATDLRLIIASMKISTNLERISDHAVGIAKRARKINTGQPMQEVQWLEPLYAQAYALLRDAMDSYTNHDPVLGQALHAKQPTRNRHWQIRGLAPSHLHRPFAGTHRRSLRQHRRGNRLPGKRQGHPP